MSKELLGKRESSTSPLSPNRLISKAYQRYQLNRINKIGAGLYPLKSVEGGKKSLGHFSLEAGAGSVEVTITRFSDSLDISSKVDLIMGWDEYSGDLNNISAIETLTDDHGNDREGRMYQGYMGADGWEVADSTMNLTTILNNLRDAEVVLAAGTRTP